MEHFWKRRSMEQLSQEQGVKRPARIEDMLGKAADLWNDDAEFEQFEQWLRDKRQMERAAAQKALDRELVASSVEKEAELVHG